MGYRTLIRARAKVNLGLAVNGYRDDGYHEIATVMQQISLCDTLLFESMFAEGVSFSCTDPELTGEDNLAYRAALFLKENYGKVLPGVRITLYKNIPVAAGLAGGSSDAAAVLLGLNKYWQLALKRQELLDIALQLGSDVPFCLQGGTALATGRGEQLDQLPSIPFFWIILALPPNIKISTAGAYRSFDRRLLGTPNIEPLTDAIRAGSRKDILSWLGSGFTNVLETASQPGSVKVASLKHKLKQCGLQPVFSGSGPTLFMVIEDYIQARSAVQTVEELGANAYLCWTTGGSEEWLDV